MNTFGSTTLQFALCDPRSVRENRKRFRRETLPLLDRVTSIYIPTGRWPVRGWVMLPRYEYVQLDQYSTTLRLDVGDPRKSSNINSLYNLAIVQAQCVTRGPATDPYALYLIELTDARGVLCNDLFSTPTTSMYNLRSPAYPDTFMTSTMNGGTTWTWSTMLADLWGQMPLLGSWPGLPYAPVGTPEGFYFKGGSAWTALCDVLDHLGMEVACDLTNYTAPYSIVSAGADDSTFTALQTVYRAHLEDDLEWIDVGSGRVPSTVKVFFKRRNTVYGTEETVTYRNDSMAQQWVTNAVYSVTVAAPTLFSGSAGSHHLWSDFTVRYDENSQPLAADVVIANQIATERVSQYFDRVYSRTSGSMTQTYAGALPFKTGSQVDGVCYYQDYRNDDRQGWRTKIVRGPYPPFSAELQSCSNSQGGRG